MPLSQDHVGPETPMGANLIADGATFRVWAPRAQDVHVVGSFGGAARWAPDAANRLLADARGYWAGFLPGVRDGDEYKFWIRGAGSAGMKRDPYARELTFDPPYPICNCVVRDPDTWPWHDAGWRPPRFDDLVVYQLHVGTFYGPDRASRVAKLLDVLDRLDYLAALGVNAIEPLPVVEFSSPRSLGYDGSDLFSPEMDYAVPPAELAPYLARVNALLARAGQPPVTAAQLAPQPNQLKALVDLCHLRGIAVILDVVYNHAGFQIGGQDESLWFFDRAAGSDPNDSLYFTDRTHTGPVFALWKQEVRQFLIDNAAFFAREHHVDGFRYDQVSVLVAENAANGWGFCQHLTDTLRAADATAVQVAEYWPVDPWVPKPRVQGGAGFDASWHDGLRQAIRGAVAQAAGGGDARVDMGAIARALRAAELAAAWRAVQYVESHDEVKTDRAPRIARLADRRDARSWYARSRARVATALLLTAPGIPMLFMGQEFLEDKPWSDNPDFERHTLLWWEGLEGGDRAMADHLRFTQELIALRRRHPALRGEGVNAFHVNDAARVLAFHRWLEGAGRDVVVVASLGERTQSDYALGLPASGRWIEVFNSDVYDHWVNPWLAGNGGGVVADGPGLHGLPASARIVIPANTVVVLALDAGDGPH
jgi:1,4-alpha-glucan branching enzyme